MAIDNHKPNARGSAFLLAGIVLGILLVAGLLTHGFGLLAPKPAASEEPPALTRHGNQILIPDGSALRKQVVTQAAATEPVRGELSVPGTVESNPALTAAVLTPLGGRVVELRVGLGDRVHKGQVLAVIDSPDLAQAYDDNAKAADAAQLTQKTLSRQEEQFKIGTISDHDLDQARSDHAQAAAEYERTQARLGLLGASADGDQHSHLLRVHAPVAGSVTSLSIAAGNMINDPTQPMMTVADLATIWVTALVPEGQIASVTKDQEADVTFTAYPGRHLHGRVSFVSDVIEPDSRRNKIRIAFPNADYALKPNMFAAVTLAGASHEQVVLPTSALLMNNDTTTVFVAVAPWTFERRTIDVELSEGSKVAVRSGVAPGEQVVVKGGILLND